MTHVRTFRAGRGARFSDEDAQEMGEFLDFNGAAERPLDADEVVEISRDKDAPTHTFIFDRPVKQAAHEHYKTRARLLGRMIYVVVEEVEADDDETEEVVTRAFFHIKDDRKQRQAEEEGYDEDDEDDEEEEVSEGYISSSVVFSDDYLSRQVINKAMRELTAWRNRYAQYVGLAEIIQSIDSWLDEQEDEDAA